MSDEQQTTPPTTEPAPDKAAEGKVFTQDDVERIVKERLARQKAQTEAQAAKAAEDAKAATLKEQGEFRTLYEAEQAKAAELAAQANIAARYEAALTKHLKALREGLPEHIIPLLDAMAPDAQLDYLSEHGAKLRATPEPEQSTPPRATPRPGVPNSARPTTPAPASPPTRPTIKF